jgi:hydroxyacylglutathione hydrolase
MRVEIIPCLSDNYAYLLVDDAGCAVVDASEEAPVSAAIARAGVPLLAILSTHHHFDHVGGNEALAAQHRVPVYGHRSDEGRLPALTHPLDDGDTFAIGSFSVRAHHVPGHTLGALAYEVTPKSGPRWAFTGDTFFLAGCGRLFEGTPAQMHASLQRIAALGDDVLIACGHEYTASNLRFAAHLEPHNADIATRAAEVAKHKGPTVPATVAVERATNPFLRTHSAELRATLGIKDGDDVAVLAATRKAKDSFR